MSEVGEGPAHGCVVDGTVSIDLAEAEVHMGDLVPPGLEELGAAEGRIVGDDPEILAGIVLLAAGA